VKILCPVDLSDASRESVRVASSLAARNAAQLVIVHVVEDNVATDDGARALRKWLANDAKPNVAWREVVLRGDAAERVREYAEEIAADLVVATPSATASTDSRSRSLADRARCSRRACGDSRRA